MKKLIVLALAIVVTLALAAVAAFAVPAGRTLEFDAKGAGKVIFSGDVHKKAGSCNVCHPAIFKMKKGADTITMKEINEGKFCGTCHNGTKAFSAKDAANCGKCHKK